MKAVNLLPSDQRGAAKAVAPAAAPSQAPSGDGFAAYMILGALALAVVAVAALALTKNTINDRTAELARTEAQVQAAAQQAAALKPYADFKQLADARVQTVRALATSRFDWEQALRDLSRALPRDARLSSFNGKVGGGAAAAAAGAASPSIEISGCTGGQTSVAKLMARLRAIRGVTRVSLKTSAKQATGAAAPATGGTGQRLCRGKNPATFAMTVLFERFGVPAVNAPVAATGAAAGATGATGPAGAAAPAPGTTTPATPTAPQASAPTNPATQGVSTP